MRVAGLTNHHPIQVGSIAMIVVELDAVATGFECYRNRSFGNFMPTLSGEREFNGSAIIYAYKEGPVAFEQVEDHHLVVPSSGNLDVIQDKVVTSYSGSTVTVSTHRGRAGL